MAMHHLQSFQVYLCDKQDDAKEIDTPLHCLSLSWNFWPADSNSIYYLLSKQFPVVELAQCLLYICNEENNYQYSSNEKFHDKIRFSHILECHSITKIIHPKRLFSLYSIHVSAECPKPPHLQVSHDRFKHVYNHFLSSIPLYSLRLISL